MKNKILLIVLFFFSFGGIVLAEEAERCTDIYELDTVNVDYQEGLTYKVDRDVCEYYDNHPEAMWEDLVVVEENDKCFVTIYSELSYERPLMTYTCEYPSNGRCGGHGYHTLCSSEGPQIQNQIIKGIDIAHSGDDAQGNPKEGDMVNFFTQDGLNLAKVVKEINKGSLSQQFKNAYDLKTIKAATIRNGLKEILVIQYVPKGSNNITTIKMNYSRSGDNNIFSSTVTVSNNTTNLLEEFPFWILSSAPNYNASELNKHSKRDLLAAFKEISNYKLTQSGNTYSLSAKIPDDINTKVLAVYSDFLETSPFTEYLQDQSSPSNEGETTSDKTSKKNKVKNTKTGAFINVKIVAIGFVIAFIGGYLVFRYTKIKKI